MYLFVFVFCIYVCGTNFSWTQLGRNGAVQRGEGMKRRCDMIVDLQSVELDDESRSRGGMAFS